MLNNKSEVTIIKVGLPQFGRAPHYWIELPLQAIAGILL